MALPGPLQALAERYGVATRHWGFDGVEREVPEQTVVRVLAALGVDASTPQTVELALGNAEDEVWRRMVPAATVVREGDTAQLPVHVDHGAAVRVRLELEGGGERELAQLDLLIPPRTVDGRELGRATFLLPADLPLGWHTLVAETGGTTASAPVAVCPVRLELPSALQEKPAWGFMTQLYSVRSRRSWGMGDFSDLRDLAAMSGRRGADFVLVNPLLAAEPAPPVTDSPYLPSSRRFLNPGYIRVEDVPETAYLSAPDRTLVEWQAELARPASLDPGPIERDPMWTAKKVALEVVFRSGRTPARQEAFEAFCSERAGLADFATWCALVEVHGDPALPADRADRSGPEVAALRDVLAERIEFHSWLQWIADEQLAAAQRASRDAGMRIGLIQDLPVGSHPLGADAWALPDVLARGVTTGAPPDMYNRHGQDWDQPPWRPDALARAGYRPFRDVLRSVLRHAGAVRIDHVMGLFRLWWIPEGVDPADGAYVTYDHEALVGVLCLEAHRAGAMVIGEDLGTVEPWVREYLAERGVLGTSIYWFEQVPPEQYRSLAMATLTTHDLPPTAGYLEGEHVEVRDSLGLLEEPVAAAREAAAVERYRVIDLLVERGLLAADYTEREVVEGMHRLLLAAPSVLIGVSLADAVGERRAQNVPGTFREYPNWCLPLADSAGRLVLLEDLFDHPRLQALLTAMPAG